MTDLEQIEGSENISDDESEGFKSKTIKSNKDIYIYY